MRFVRVIAMLMPLATSGCFVSADYTRAHVTVIDGETARPIARAMVHAPAHSGAGTDRSSTDSDGRARVRVATYVGGLWAEADGYLPSIEHPPAGEVQIALYRPPKPEVGLLLPAGFRGVLKTREGKHPQESSSPSIPPDWPMGTREFLTPVVIDGITDVKPPPRLSSDQPRGDVRLARFDDGTPLRYENAITYISSRPIIVTQIRDRVRPRADGVALFHVGVRGEPNGGGYAIYVVGTIEQARAVQNEQRASAAKYPDAKPLAAGRYFFFASPLHLKSGESPVPFQP